MHIGRYKILRVFIYDTVAKPLRVQIDSLRPVRQVCSVLLLEIRNLFLARPFGAGQASQTIYALLALRRILNHLALCEYVAVHSLQRCKSESGVAQSVVSLA